MAEQVMESDFEPIAAGVEPDALTSPIARWNRITSALQTNPEWRRYLDDPRLRPAKVAKLARNVYLSPSCTLGSLAEVLPLGDGALASVDQEWLKARSTLHAIDAVGALARARINPLCFAFVGAGTYLSSA